MFSERLKELRKKNNLTQDDIANKFGVTDATVSSWEVGKAQPSYNILLELAKMFGVTTDYLLGFDKTDYDNMKKLENLLNEVGIDDPEKIMQIIEILRRKNNSEQ